jgi:hypothetical protein
MMNEKERETALADMRKASDAFYVAATRIGNHPFIEFCGLMNEYIQCCQRAHAAGIDFTECSTHTGQALPIADVSLAYMNEKLECIFQGAIMAVGKVAHDEKDEEVA